MTACDRRQLLQATLVAGLEAGGARRPASGAETGPPIRTRMFWTWDHSTEWQLNLPGAQTQGCVNPYFRSREAFIADYTRLLEWCGRHAVDAVVVWGLLRERHGGVDAARKLCEVAARNNVRLLGGVGLAAYGGVYYQGASRYSMAGHLERHPDLAAVDEKGNKVPFNTQICPSRRENRDFVLESLHWLFETLPELGGVQMESGDSGTCRCALCTRRRKHPTGKFSWEDMALLYGPAADAIRAVSPGAWIVCETYSHPEPHANPAIQGEFGEGKPPWADEHIAKFPDGAFLQWVCDDYVRPLSRKTWTQAGSVSANGRRNVMRAHYSTYWRGRRGELAIDWIADMVQKSIAAGFDTISLFGEVSPFQTGAELNYLALEHFGSSRNPRADVDLFLREVAAPRLGGRRPAQDYLRHARLLDAEDRARAIPAALGAIFAECAKHPPEIARRWAWLGNYLASFVA